jgi:hypothetical protein
MIRYHALMTIHCNQYDQQVHIQIRNLLYYKQRSLLHVSATYCGHLQAGVQPTSTHTTTTSARMVSPHTHTHTQHINTQLNANNFINILYFNTEFKLLCKT